MIMNNFTWHLNILKIAKIWAKKTSYRDAREKDGERRKLWKQEEFK